MEVRRRTVMTVMTVVHFMRPSTYRCHMWRRREWTMIDPVLRSQILQHNQYMSASVDVSPGPLPTSLSFTSCKAAGNKVQASNFAPCKHVHPTRRPLSVKFPVYYISRFRMKHQHRSCQDIEPNPDSLKIAFFGTKLAQGSIVRASAAAKCSFRKTSAFCSKTSESYRHTTSFDSSAL
jgi:hypothetical protein